MNSYQQPNILLKQKESAESKQIDVEDAKLMDNENNQLLLIVPKKQEIPVSNEVEEIDNSEYPGRRGGKVGGKAAATKSSFCSYNSKASFRY